MIKAQLKIWIGW